LTGTTMLLLRRFPYTLPEGEPEPLLTAEPALAT
jgi:hypothetical protein